MRSADNLADRIAIAVLAAVAIVAAFTFRDYGLAWDDYTHSQYGDLLLKLYGSGFADTRALSFVNLFMYGGGFDMAAALAAKVLPFDLFETRRLTGAAIGILGLFATWRLGRRISGPFAGLCAMLLLAACPLYYGHMFMNAKDAPFAVAMIVLLLGAVRALDEYPNPSRRSMVLIGVALGAAFGSRILAVVAGPYLAASLLLIIVAETRILGLRAAAARLGRFVWTLLPALPIAYLIMGLLWPWSMLAPLNPLRAAEYFDKFFEKPWRELYEGTLISVTNMPASYLPHLFTLKLPEIMLALGFAGGIGALVAAARRDLPVSRRAGLLIVTLAAFLPVAIAMVTRPALYNGLRHFMFLTPPFAVLGGLAAAWGLSRASAHSRLAAGARLPPCLLPASPSRSPAWCGCIPINIRISICWPAACAAPMTTTCSITGALPSNRPRRNCAPGLTPRPSNRPKAGAGWWRSAGRSRRRAWRSARNSKPRSTRRRPTSLWRSAHFIAGICRRRLWAPSSARASCMPRSTTSAAAPARSC